MRTRGIVGIAVLGSVASLGVAGVVAGTTTSYSETPTAYFGRPGDPGPPPWSRPCWRGGGPGDRYVLRCGRVQGLIVFHESRDPDGDGDVHGVAIAGARLVVLKSRRDGGRAARVPGIGRRVDLAGPVLEGRWGLTTIDVRRQRARR